MNTSNRQRGVALVVALVLLLILTVLALASVRGTSLQERMSANMYDRSLAFQRAEAAMRAAEAALSDTPQISVLGGTDCSPATGVACPLVPANAFSAGTGSNTGWINVPTLHNVNSDRTPGTPQYSIQLVGTGFVDNNFDLAANADCGNYGNPCPSDNVAYYRVTTRSSNPGDGANRAVVVLQSTYRRGLN
jgi:type IV pilus assembly protein PilX